MKNEPAPLYDRSTKTLCEDSLHLCFDSAHASHEMASRTMARASFFATTMFLEAAANASLETLDASGQLLEKVDKFPVLQKFEFFAQSRFGKRIDHSSHIVQQLNELFVVRNRYVHPKAQVLEWKPIASNSMIGVPKASPSLQLPLVSTYFRAEHAIQSILVCHAFLKNLLIDLCEMAPKKSTAMIFSLIKQPATAGMAAGPFLYEHMRDWMAHERINLDHFEHGYHG